MDKNATTDEQDRAIMARRIMRLEERLDRLEGGSAGPGAAPHPAWPFALGGTAAVFGCLGMGVPSHPYPYLFAGLLLLLAYHRRSLRMPKGH